MTDDAANPISRITSDLDEVKEIAADLRAVLPKPQLSARWPPTKVVRSTVA